MNSRKCCYCLSLVKGCVIFSTLLLSLKSLNLEYGWVNNDISYREMVTILLSNQEMALLQYLN